MKRKRSHLRIQKFTIIWEIIIIIIKLELKSKLFFLEWYNHTFKKRALEFRKTTAKQIELENWNEAIFEQRYLCMFFF